MKKLIMLTLVVAATAGVQAQNIISWNDQGSASSLSDLAPDFFVGI
jgi:hypothetical protein